MKTSKVLRRLARTKCEPGTWHTVARDIGLALARAERDELQVVARELAASAPPEGSDPGSYWAGFAAAMGMVLASYESAHEQADARELALQVLSAPSARNILCSLASGPATGAELSARIGLTPSGISKILKSLRSAGLVRLLGGPAVEVPERGAPKPHALTPLGATLANEITVEIARTKQAAFAAG